MRDIPTKILVDAVVLASLMRGDQLSDPANPEEYVVSWPEFAFLTEIACEATARRIPPRTIAAIEQIGRASGQARRTWLPALIEVGRIMELNHLDIEVASPPSEASMDFVASISALGLSSREATNLVLAEWRGLTFRASQATLSVYMQRALSQRRIPCDVIVPAAYEAGLAIGGG
jgi:hypothetical protein